MSKETEENQIEENSATEEEQNQPSDSNTTEQDEEMYVYEAFIAEQGY